MHARTRTTSRMRTVGLHQQSGGLTECREPASRPVLPVRIARRAPRSRPPPVPSTHAMALRPSSVPLRVPLPAPPESSLPEAPNPESDRARSASPVVSSLFATAVTEPSFETAAASALVAELLDFAAACRLDYATALVAESVFASPPSVGGECALGTDVLEDRQEDFECLAAAVPRFASMLLAPEGDPDAPDIPTPRSYAEAITGPYSSRWQAAMDAKMASWKSTGTYVDEVPPPGANIVDGMWIFKGVDYFETFSPTPKMTTLQVLLHVAAQCDYELHSLDFSTAFLQGSLHKEIKLRRPPGFTGTFPAGTQWSLHRPVYGLHQAPREWHNTPRTTLVALGFAPATADPSLFLRTDTSLPPFYVLVYVDDLVFATADTEALTLVLQRFGFHFSSPKPTPLSTSHSLSAPPSDESVEPSGLYPELVGCLMYLMTCTRPDLAYPLSLLARYVAPGRHQKVHWDAAKRVLRYLCNTSGMGLVLGGRGPVVLTGHADASWVDDSATQRSSQGYTFSLGSGSVSWRSTHLSLVLNSSCEAEIYAGAMAAQELCWLTYLLTDLGEQPRLPPVLYVDNKAMIALSWEHRLEHRTKHIALRYFLARELQQRGQLRLAYVATRANTADVFTKALLPSDHQRFATVLGLLALLFLTGLVTTCSPPLCLRGGPCAALPVARRGALGVRASPCPSPVAEPWGPARRPSIPSPVAEPWGAVRRPARRPSWRPGGQRVAPPLPSPVAAPWGAARCPSRRPSRRPGGLRVTPPVARRGALWGPRVAPSHRSSRRPGGPRATLLPLTRRPSCYPRFCPALGVWGWRVWGWWVCKPSPPPPPSPTAAAVAEGGGGVAAVKPAAPVAHETVAPVAREPVAPVAREPVAPVARESVASAARLAAEPVTPVARVPVAPVASVPVAPVARVPVALVTSCASSFSCRPLPPLLS
ncbi:unnamed protein product [Closterium sp. NIES-53]